MIGAPICARCDDAAMTVVIGFSAVQVYLDLCQAHLADELTHARPLGPRGGAGNPVGRREAEGIARSLVGREVGA